MNHSVTLKKRSDISIASNDPEGPCHLVEAYTVTTTPYTLDHFSALGTSEKRDGQRFVGIGINRAKFIPVLLKMVLLVLLVRESMNCWYSSPAFAGL